MNATLALTEMPKLVATWVSGLPVAPLGIVTAVLVLYIVLGCVMDELSMLLLTIPVIFPAVMALDLWGLSYEAKALWFGILVLMTVSFGLIAPPVGLNVYVVNSMTREVPMSETYRGLVPFLVWDLLRMATLLFVPCVGYSAGGYRLGYGGGFYDRTLGLWLSRRIARMHQGDLVYVSQPEGARMRLALPLEAL